MKLPLVHMSSEVYMITAVAIVSIRLSTSFTEERERGDELV